MQYKSAISNPLWVYYLNMNSKILIIIASLLHMGIYLYAAPEHAVDINWPVHARFHIVQAIFWIFGLDGVAVALAYHCLPNGPKWVLPAFALIFVTAHLGYFISMLLIPAGRPPEMYAHFALATPLVIFLWGWALECRNQFNTRSQ